ncbi:MAG: PAS domain-containing protein, partial [Gammaproteobacteria bacterium]
MASLSTTPRFLGSANETAALLHSTDWSRSSLGAPATWPAELVTVVRLLMGSSFPMFVAWGPELGFIYNHAYATILGDKHPAAFGRPFKEIWYEIWDDISPIIDAALAGRSSYFDDLPLLMMRKGYPEQTWFTFSYSPVQNAEGQVVGMCCTCVETTDRVLGARRQAFQLALADRLRPLRDPDQATAAATELLGRHLQAERTFYCEVSDDGEHFTVRQDWTAPGVASMTGQLRRLDAFGTDVIDALRGGGTVFSADVCADARTRPHADSYAGIGVRAYLAVPVLKDSQLIAILCVHYARPHPWTDAEVELARDTVERTWATVEQARAEQQRQRYEDERDHLLKELQAANQRITDVFRQAPAFMCVLTGPEHVFELANERYLQLVGERNLIGKRARDALPDVEGQGFFELLDQVYRSGEPFIGADMAVMLRRQPGEAAETRYLDFVYMPLRDAYGAVAGIMAHGVDQTERRLAEQALRASEERYRTLFESMDQAFAAVEMIFDERGRAVDFLHLEVNPLHEKHSGLSNLVGTRASQTVPTLSQFWYDTLGRVALTGEPIRFESEAIGRWFDVYATRMGGDG